MTPPRVEVFRVAGHPLVEALLGGAPEVAPFYGGAPGELESYRRKLQEVTARFDRPARERAAAALRPVSARARERLRRFVEQGGAMVTTGQQAGLFTGPMYTLHKALTAARLAAELEPRLGVLVLPVFWVASEDHDFAEVNHAWAVTAAGDLRRCGIARTARVPVPMSEMKLAPGVEELTGEFVQCVSEEQDGADYLQDLLSSYRPGATVAEAFGETLGKLLSGFDFCLVDAADPVLKHASLPILTDGVAAAEEHERQVAERTSELAALGFAPPVALAAGATHLFYHGPAGRERLHRDGADFVAPEAAVRFTGTALQRELEADPVRFSPNVLLRPVVESALFPTLAYVGGPAETAYFAQIDPLFGSFGIRPPVAFPRFAARVVPEPVAAAQRGLALPDQALARPEHELLEQVARARLSPGVSGVLAELRAEVVRGFGTLADAAAEIDPTLVLALGGRRNRVLLELAAAERKILRQLKRTDRELGRGVRLVRNHLRPLGAPQERVLTVLQYLGGYRDLLTSIAERIEIRFSDAV